MKKNMSWKFTDESSVTFQLSVSGAGEFGHKLLGCVKLYSVVPKVFLYTSIVIFPITYTPRTSPSEIFSKYFKNYYGSKQVEVYLLSKVSDFSKSHMSQKNL